MCHRCVADSIKIYKCARSWLTILGKRRTAFAIIS